MDPDPTSAFLLGRPPFVSYAQNLEDVMLRRALKNVERGRYIDVGAGEPEADSVTKAFYDAGWRGVNVEPLAGPYERIAAARPEDTNLNVAVGQELGEASIFVVGAETGLSTLSPEFAARYASDGWTLEERRVPVTTLAALCAEHVQGEVHFLKIDAEGHEFDILRGADWSRWRPWILLIEAVDPVHHGPVGYDEWERDILFPNGYRFAYDDGLNRFYVAAEREAALLPSFRTPPNIFDGYVLARDEKARAEWEQARIRLEGLLNLAQERADLAHGRVHSAQESVREEQGRVAAANARADDAQGIAHRLMARAVEFEARVAAAEAASREAAGQLRASQASLERAEARYAEQRASWTASAADKDAELARLSVERDAWAQELFESNRFAAQLVISRQSLADDLASQTSRLQGLVAGAEQERDQLVLHAQEERDRTVQHLLWERDDALNQQRHSAEVLDIVLRSTSWRITRPIRAILRALGKRRGAGT